MATYLQLVQEAAALSGTIDRRSVATVATAGRVGFLAELVKDAWLEMQNRYRAWEFLIAELPDGATLPQAAEPGQTAPALALPPASLISGGAPAWEGWVLGGGADEIPLTVWDADAPDDEAALQPMNYQSFRATYQRGSSRRSAVARPQVVSVDTADRLVFWPAPDRDYRLSGTYRRAPQVLAADSDVPIIASQFHNAIVWQAVLLLHRYDEADANVLITTEQGARDRMAALRRRYLGDSVSVRRRPLGGLHPGASISVVNNFGVIR